MVFGGCRTGFQVPENSSDFHIVDCDLTIFRLCKDILEMQIGPLHACVHFSENVNQRIAIEDQMEGERTKCMLCRLGEVSFREQY